MRKIVALLLTVVLLFSGLSAFADDYSFLDSMTLDEMTALQKELESRISAAKAKAGASDPTNTGMWEIRYYVDEFDNPTTEGYITNTKWIWGTFNNSATTNSDLKVKWLIDKDSIALKLFEYGSYQVKNSWIEAQDYSIAMLDPNGNKTNWTGYMLSGGDRIYLRGSDTYKKIIDTFSLNGSVTFRIVESDNQTTNYLFKMEDTSFFANAYSMLK